MYHITQPTEAHTPQAAADPGSGPNTAAEESPPDNTNSQRSVPAYTVSSPYYHTDPDHHIPSPIHAEADNRTRPLAAGVIVRILLAAAVVGIVEAAEEVTGQAKHLQGMWDEAAVVVGDQGRQRSVVVLVTHSAPMVAVVHPVVVMIHSALTVDAVVHSAQTVAVVVHSADESEDNSPFRGTPNSHTGPAPAETC